MNRQFGPYDISRELVRGAMGVVSLAMHRSLQRECALKTIALKLKDPHAAERFIREGQAIAKLGKHPNIMQVFDARIVDITPYIAMEFVEEGTLKSLSVRRGPFSKSELIELGHKIALALDHAHRREIMHRNVKLANVLMDTDGEPSLNWSLCAEQQRRHCRTYALKKWYIRPPSCSDIYRIAVVQNSTAILSGGCDDGNTHDLV